MIAVLVLLNLSVSAIHAQHGSDGSQVFDTELMRFELKGLSPGIVLNETHYPLTRHGLNLLDIPMSMYERSAEEFEQYRAARTAYTVWSIGGAVLAGVGSALLSVDYPILGVGVATAGIGSMYIGLFRSTAATGHLYSAVNGYNRERLSEVMR